ncbi:MAG: hypothetical protein BWK79_10850 [Beggiatoa sp. IS2]|nr:MAG: hypothetical protein BWK79_10850 [Beggiatoa sp. IS2]
MVAQPSCFTGVVKWFDQQNGYGLITPLNGGADVFAHFSTITTSDNNAQKVLFPGQVVDFGMVYDDSMGRNRTTWVVPKQIYQ